MNRIKNLLNKFFSYTESFIKPFDDRSLGMFRIALGIAIIYNIIIYRFPAVGVFYNNSKWLPEASADDYYGIPFPLFNLISENWWYYLLLSIMLGLSIFFIVGFKMKWVTPLLFVLFGSMITTSPYISHGVEYLEEVALFWSLFLPLDRRLVFFRSLNSVSRNQLFGKWAHLGLQLQLLFIYFSSWIFKNGTLWRDGKILEVVSNDLIHAKSILIWLGNYPILSQICTYTGFYLEVLVSILILISIFNKKSRLWTFIVIILLHGIMATLLHVGTFFLIGLAFSLLFLNDKFWNRKFFSKYPFLSSNTVDKIKYQKTMLFNKVILIIIIAFIFRSNLHYWSGDSYISPILKKLPLYDYTIKPQVADPGIFMGVWHQPWKFFPNNIYPDLGDFLFIGYDSNGNTIELRTNKKINIVENIDDVVMDPLPHTSYFGADFTFGVYYKFYMERFPKETQKWWLDYHLTKFHSKYPNVNINQAQLWKIERLHSYKDDELILEENYTKLIDERL